MAPSKSKVYMFVFIFKGLSKSTRKPESIESIEKTKKSMKRSAREIAEVFAVLFV